MAQDTPLTLRNLNIYSIFTRNYSQEGTFKAVQEDLDRIQALGTDVIWFLPFYPNGEVNKKGTIGSPYAISNYREIDPRHGTLEDFKELIKAAHDKGLKVMIGIVFNHTSPDSYLVKHHPDWFYKKPNGDFGNRVGDWYDVIDLDYNQKELWNHQLETIEYWRKSSMASDVT
ncbi:alpha-amylase family glycosyl hydrolase [Dolosicoccus paucivorans]|uniref:alpha-amylase family glycosyl hydrolase n=1 Tax=Dolosicoccus paucivorans TaxID=84521 RepID=UPI000883AD75|nr:alpha-amylase family glycosyl hydrolase [Dolosicoccus paucivorans]SDI61169.1 Alpha amylase, catalytic domain [Dolosicoccus paucivorans]